MVIDTGDMDKFAVPAAIGAGGALALSLIVPPAAIVVGGALAYGGYRAYRRFGIPDIGGLVGRCHGERRCGEGKKKEKK